MKIEPDDTLGSLYFGKIFPMSVAPTWVEVADLVVTGKAPAVAQHESEAGYEGIIRDAESKVAWATHVDITYNLIRGCDPAPGAWTTVEGRKLYLFDSAKRIARTFSEVKGKKLGEVVALNDSDTSWCTARAASSLSAACAGTAARKPSAADAGITVGAILGSLNGDHSQAEDNERVAWFNGKIVPESRVLIPFRDSGFLRGDAVFDADAQLQLANPSA